MAIKKAERPISQTKRRLEANAAAMPDVREVVKKHGLTAVNSCLTKLREFDKKARQAQKLREEADKLESELDGQPRIRATA
jgi:hypothetical protein